MLNKKPAYGYLSGLTRCGSCGSHLVLGVLGWAEWMVYWAEGGWLLKFGLLPEASQN